MSRAYSRSGTEKTISVEALATLYDKIGSTYSGRRQSDPRIAAAIDGAAAGCNSILNVGAGTGSYELASRFVIAVEPSGTMIAQRPVGAAPVIQGCAEALPFPDSSFEAVLGILTVHHWKDQAQGLSECARIARTKVVILTNDFDVCANFWLFDYIPELLRIDRHIFPNIARYENTLGPLEAISVPFSRRLSRRFSRCVLEATDCVPGSYCSGEHFHVLKNWQC
jgi:ubiquinone/menaquinone biosynthesis C-methylase UbiE